MESSVVADLAMVALSLLADFAMLGLTIAQVAIAVRLRPTGRAKHRAAHRRRG